MKNDGTPYTTLPQPLDYVEEAAIPDGSVTDEFAVVCFMRPNIRLISATGASVNRGSQEQLSDQRRRMLGS